jgi:putative membrane protein
MAAAKPVEPATRRVVRALLPGGDSVQLSILVLNLVYAALGVVLMYVSYRIIDRLTPEVDFPAELKRGNVAVAIFIAALFVSIALIVGRAIG